MAGYPIGDRHTQQAPGTARRNEKDAGAQNNHNHREHSGDGRCRAEGFADITGMVSGCRHESRGQRHHRNETDRRPIRPARACNASRHGRE